MSKKKKPAIVITENASTKISGMRPWHEKQQTFRVIVQTTEDDYVPTGFDVCTRIKDIFTANCDRAALESIESDERVKSVAISKRLWLDKPKREVDEG